MSIPKILQLSVFTSTVFLSKIQAQSSDTTKEQILSIHGQATTITQFQSKFSAKYSGVNSLSDNAQNATSSGATLFMAGRLWKNSTLIFDPEIMGGRGLSEATGIAEPTNGETFRVGSPEPKVYIARLILNQIIPLTKEREWQDNDANQLRVKVPTKYLSVTVGKVNVGDYFDNNTYAHDPRSQFMNWNLMDAGAWDYPANTRGYTPSVVLQYISKNNTLSYGFSLVSVEANGSVMNWNIMEAHSQTVEFDHNYQIARKAGTIRLLAFLNNGDMGSYAKALQQLPDTPNIVLTRKYGRVKYGFAVNAEQQLTKDVGVFLRGSWNNGKTETWAFTEIDQTVSLGGQLIGNSWHRPNDKMGLAYAIAGISKQHREYLQAGGSGFILGDGNLNYGAENMLEAYYNAQITKNIFIGADYQCILRPGYNEDRKGLVHIFSVRVHFEL